MDVEKPPAPASRAAHGRALKAALDAAVTEANQRRADAAIQVRGAVPGIYVQFESQPGVSLKLSSLEDSQQGIELVEVSHVDTSGPAPRRIERATGSTTTQAVFEEGAGASAPLRARWIASTLCRKMLGSGWRQGHVPIS